MGGGFAVADPSRPIVAAINAIAARRQRARQFQARLQAQQAAQREAQLGDLATALQVLRESGARPGELEAIRASGVTGARAKGLAQVLAPRFEQREQQVSTGLENVERSAALRGSGFAGSGNDPRAQEQLGLAIRDLLVAGPGLARSGELGQSILQAGQSGAIQREEARQQRDLEQQKTIAKERRQEARLRSRPASPEQQRAFANDFLRQAEPLIERGRTLATIISLVDKIRETDSDVVKGQLNQSLRFTISRAIVAEPRITDEERAASIGGQSFAQEVRRSFDKFFSGEEFNDEDLDAFLLLARSLFKTSREETKRLRRDFVRRGKEARVPENAFPRLLDIFVDPESNAPPPEELPRGSKEIGVNPRGNRLFVTPDGRIFEDLPGGPLREVEPNDLEPSQNRSTPAAPSPEPSPRGRPVVPSASPALPGPDPNAFQDPSSPAAPLSPRAVVPRESTAIGATPPLPVANVEALQDPRTIREPSTEISPTARVLLDAVRPVLNKVPVSGKASLGEMLTDEQILTAGRFLLETSPAVAAPQILARNAAQRLGAAALRNPATRQAIRQMFIRRVGAAGSSGAAGSLAAESFDPSEDPLLRAAKVGSLEALGEGLFPAVGAVIRRVPLLSRLAASKPSELIEGAKEAIGVISSRVGVISPGLLTDNRFVDFLENMLEGSLFGGGGLARTRRRAIKLGEQAVTDFANRFVRNADSSMISRAVREIGEQGRLVFETTKRVMFRRVDRAARDIFVDVSPLKNRASKILNNLTLPSRNAPLRGIINDILNEADRISFERASFLRSELARAGREGGQDVGGPAAQKLARQLAKMADTQMAQAAKNLNPEALRLFRESTKFVRENVEKFDTAFMRTIANASPDDVVQALIRPRNAEGIRTLRSLFEDARVIRRVRRVIGDDDIWRKVQGEFINDILRTDPAAAGGQLLESTLDGRQALRRLTEFSEETLEAAFSKGELAEFRKLLRTLEIVQAKAARGVPGGFLIQVGQGGAALQLATGGKGGKGFTRAALTILMAPPVVAKFFTDPDLVRLVIRGLRAKPGSEVANRAFSQIATRLGAEQAGLLQEDRE